MITLPTEWKSSGSTIPSLVGSGVKFAQCGFGLPPPGSGIFSTLPAAVAIRHSRPVIGTRSPGFTTMRFALP